MAVTRAIGNDRALGCLREVVFRLVPHFMRNCVADSPDAGKRPCDNEQRSAATPCSAKFAGRQRVAPLWQSCCHAPGLISSMPSLRQRVHRRLLYLASHSLQGSILVSSSWTPRSRFNALALEVEPAPRIEVQELQSLTASVPGRVRPPLSPPRIRDPNVRASFCWLRYLDSRSFTPTSQHAGSGDDGSRDRP